MTLRARACSSEPSMPDLACRPRWWPHSLQLQLNFRPQLLHIVPLPDCLALLGHLHSSCAHRPEAHADGHSHDLLEDGDILFHHSLLQAHLERLDGQLQHVVHHVLLRQARDLTQGLQRHLHVLLCFALLGLQLSSLNGLLVPLFRLRFICVVILIAVLAVVVIIHCVLILLLTPVLSLRALGMPSVDEGLVLPVLCIHAASVQQSQEDSHCHPFHVP
mmetsp:Transcript_55523/g.129213  ORF Transcript_55523/g.129213 Transcript_55523/m.129213 type:complete len:218 (+) Transcript_55523:286-939(+)